MKKIGEILIAQGKITERDIERALIAQGEMGEMIGQVLVKLGLVAEADLIAALAGQLEIAVQPSDGLPETPIILEGISQEFLFNNLVVPVAQSDTALTLVAAKPQDPYIRKALEMASGKQIEMRLLATGEIQRLLDLYTVSETDGDDEDGELGDGDGDDEFIEHLRDLASEAPVIRMVNQIIHRALDMGASDIHIEPFEEGIKLRYRVDGVLYQHNDPPPANLAAAVASRIKLLSRMNIAERRLPQDGRIMTRVKGHELDLRVSTVPTVHGESIVMRVLDRESIRLELSDMGFSPDTLKRYQELLARPHGVLLITGPTGSGKTTTLYASLASLDSNSLKIVTVEDPVEYQLPGINQIQVHSQIDMSFARALRAILRQDPDIIMIGEMRDSETAQIAVQSALTGHLVLSTLHTNTAAGAITRLEDMGIERYLITSSVNGVMAQRLVRTLCKECRKEIEIPDEELVSSGLKRFANGQTTFFTANGCSSCMQTGYSGRSSIHEIFIMDDELQHAIMVGSDATTLHTLARKKGMLTLYEDGLRKVVRGMTSLEEIKRVTQDQQGDGSLDDADVTLTVSGAA